MMGCDTLLTVGSNFPYTQFMPELDQARAVQIDRSGKWIGMRYPYEVNLVGDAQADPAGAASAAGAQVGPVLAREGRRSTCDQWWDDRATQRAMTDADPINPMRHLLGAVPADARRTRSSPPTPDRRRTGTPAS